MIEVAVFKQGDQFIAWASALDVAGYGDSQGQAIDDLAQVVNITLQWAERNNTLNELPGHWLEIKAAMDLKENNYEYTYTIQKHQLHGMIQRDCRSFLEVFPRKHNPCLDQ